jgi:STE24 endopeptidase
MSDVLSVILCLLFLRLAAQLWLDTLNLSEVRRFADAPPEAIADVMSGENYRKSVAYSIAKLRFSMLDSIYDSVVLAVVLISGVLPWLYQWVTDLAGRAAWAQSLFFFAAVFLLGLPSIPMEWWAQFKLEGRFGFNRSSLGLWVADRFKGWIIGLLIGFPLLWLLLKLVEWLGAAWWLWGFGIFAVFQMVMIVVYPAFIMPLFNKFTPLEEGALRERLLGLAHRTKFRAASIQVMDGSRRSAHSNAFFTGFGGFRRIVLFDTLIEQLSEPELEAVLAHEIGHYKKRHIIRMLALSFFMVLAGFFVIDRLAASDWFLSGFGFAESSMAAVFLLVALLGGTVTFWLSPIFNLLSRKHEYEADAYAVDVTESRDAMIGALRGLVEKNLANLTPHPLYSRFYYSHPTFAERSKAISGLAQDQTETVAPA